MSKTNKSINKGDYAYSSHTVLVSGDIVDVFVGRWEWQDEDTRILRKYPRETELVGGETMCVMKLRRPMTMDEYREAHHPDFRPMVKTPDSEVELVLMPTGMACTIPDGM